MTDVWHVLFLNLIFPLCFGRFCALQYSGFRHGKLFSFVFFLPTFAWCTATRHPPLYRHFFTPTLSNSISLPIYSISPALFLECTAPFMVSVAAYVVGLLFYAFHFPECKWPGKFDTWGSSHQVRYFICLTVRVEWAGADGI